MLSRYTKQNLKQYLFVATWLTILTLTCQAGVTNENSLEEGGINTLLSMQDALVENEAAPMMAGPENGRYWFLSSRPAPLCSGPRAAPPEAIFWCSNSIVPVFTAFSRQDDAALSQEGADAVKAAKTHPESIAGIIEGSAETNADPALMLSVAWLESRFDSHSRNPASSATGLYQFTDASWGSAIEKFGGKYGLKAPEVAHRTARKLRHSALRTAQMRKNPRIAAVMAAEEIKSEASQAEMHIGRPLSRDEVYLVHVLGVRGAETFIRAAERSPRELCLAVIPVAAHNNPGLFTSGNKRPLTVGEAMARLHNKLNKVYLAVSGISARK
jgi:hypothetical protein